MSTLRGEIPSHEPLQPGITAEEESQYNNYIERNNVNKERVAVWLEAISIYATSRPQTFEAYTRDLGDAVEVGNQLVAAKQATGFNIIENEDYFPIAASDPLIIYSMSVRRRLHIAILIAQMEQEGIIIPGQISFGGKASAVKLGDWHNDPRDAVIRPVTVVQNDLSNAPEVIDFEDTTEVCTIFKPTNMQNTENISRFLFERVFLKKGLDFIPESWVVPDIRATSSLQQLVHNPLLIDEQGNSRFTTVTTNLLTFPSSQLLVMKQREVFDSNQGWGNIRHPLNTQLFEYLEVQKED